MNATINKGENKMDIMEFMKRQLLIEKRICGLKTEEEVREAMKKNMEKWCRMYIAIHG